jgi:hypothetical protein
MKPSFDVTIRVNEKHLGTLLGVITEDREYELRGVARVSDTSVPQEPKSRFRDGKRDKGISGMDLIIQTLKNGKPQSRQELEKVFEGRGFAASSTNPALTRLREEGRIRGDNFGHYSFVK